MYIYIYFKKKNSYISQVSIITQKLFSEGTGCTFYGSQFSSKLKISLLGKIYIYINIYILLTKFNNPTGELMTSNDRWLNIAWDTLPITYNKTHK